MPLPFIIGGLAAAAGAVGVGSGIKGGMRLKDANDIMKVAQTKQENAVNLFNKKNDETLALMDELGTKELEILSSFDDFSSIIEKIQGRPEFKDYKREGVNLPVYEAEELKKVSAGAGLILGGVGGAAAGTAGGVAAAGATTTAVMALGTASTGTAISALSGAAASNAALAAIGGGSIAAGGGGMALGTAILGGATLGVGLLIGGVIFNVTGSKLSDKAVEAYIQSKRTEEEVGKIVSYLDDLSETASNYSETLSKVDKSYREHLDVIDRVVNKDGKVQWSDFTEEEKKKTENTVLLVGLLYMMCQVKLVLKQDNEELNEVNHRGVEYIDKNASLLLEEIA